MLGCNAGMVPEGDRKIYPNVQYTKTDGETSGEANAAESAVKVGHRILSGQLLYPTLYWNATITVTIVVFSASI